MFYKIETADFSRLRHSVAEAGGHVLATKSTLVGRGPDCYYWYEALAYAPKSVADAGPNQLVDAVFGVGPEPRDLEVVKIGAAKAKEFLKNAQNRYAMEIVPEGDVSMLDTYRTYGGGVAARVDNALIDYLAKHPVQVKPQETWKGRMVPPCPQLPKI